MKNSQKTLFKSLLAALLAAFFVSVLPSFLAAADFKQGEHFVELKMPLANAENSVSEIFSYSCIHCYNHFSHDTLGKLKEIMPNLKYELAHVNWLGEDVLLWFYYAKYKDEQNGIQSGDKNSTTHLLSSVMFDSFFKKRLDFANKKTLKIIEKNALEALGTNIQSIRELEKKGAFAKFISAQTPIDEAVLKSGTPSFVVNGKYQILPSSFGSLAELAAIVDFLSKK